METYMENGTRYVGANEYSAAGLSQDNLDAYNRLSGVAGEQTVISGHRSPERNAAVGGAQHSQHIPGNALDIDVSHMNEEQKAILIQQARAAGYGGVGVYGSSLHFDTGPERAWGPDYTSASLQDWAIDATGTERAAYKRGEPHDLSKEGGAVPEPEQTRGQKIAGAFSDAMAAQDTGPSLNSRRPQDQMSAPVEMIPMGIPT